MTATRIAFWLLVVALVAALVYEWRFTPERQAFAAFMKKRAELHRRCSAQVAAGRAADPTAFDACASELAALLDEAERRGW